MATLATIAAGRKLGKLTRVLFTPWTSETDEGDNPSYDLDNMLADSVAINEADPTINSIANETKDEPMFQIPTLGDVTIALSSGEIPNELLESAFGYVIDDDGNAYRPSTYKYVYGKFQFAFDSSDDIIEIPKVMVAANVTGSSFSSNIVLGNISGTAYSKEYSIQQGAEAIKYKSAYVIKKGGKADLPTAA